MRAATGTVDTVELTDLAMVNGVLSTLGGSERTESLSVAIIVAVVQLFIVKKLLKLL